MGIKKIINTLLHKTGYSINRLYRYDSNIDDVERLQAKQASGEPIKLHFGCGPRILKGWVNIDLSYAHYGPYLQFYTDEHYPESIRGDRTDFYQINILTDGLPLPDNSVDLIFHEDFFEHLTQKQQVIFLAETFRVMKKDAIQRVNTPNLVASMRDGSDFTKGKNGVHIGEWDNWEHFSVISPAILTDMAKMVGYSSVVFNSKNQSIAADRLPKEYRPDAKDRPADDANVFADLVK